MKAKSGFILRELAGEYVLAPAGDRLREYRDVVLMNELSAFLWQRLREGATRGQLLDAVLSAYEVEKETAEHDLDAALERFFTLGIIERDDAGI